MTLSSMKTAAARTLTEMNTAESRKPHLTLARSETHDTLRNCVRRKNKTTKERDLTRKRSENK